MKFNQERYLERLGCVGKHVPTIETLRTLHYAHLLNIPFENLDIHHQTPIVLDIDSIFNKIINGRRGGFCYELNGLFYELLHSIGFKAKRVSARVMDKEGNYPPEFDHMAIIVEVSGVRYLVDVGCGEFTLEPLLLMLGIIQQDPSGEFIIDRFNDGYRVSKIVSGELKPEYIFTDISRDLLDFEARCIYQQSDPTSHFMKKRMITRPTKTGRISIAGLKLKIKEGNAIEEVVLEDDRAFYQALLKHFDIRLDA